MKNNIIILYIFLICTNVSFAQSWIWAKNVMCYNPYSCSRGMSIVNDNFGHCYIAGYFNDSINFGFTMLSSNGSEDILLIKYDTSGNFKWVKKAGGSSNDAAIGIGVDNLGNVYISGYFQDSTIFDSLTLYSYGSADSFLAKYDSLGNVLWVRQIGDSGFDGSYSLFVDNFGNSYCSGIFNNTIQIGTSTFTSMGGNDIFIAKYDCNGNALWAKQIGSFDSWEVIQGTTVDNNGNIIITGRFSNILIIDTDTLIAEGYLDLFLIKYDNNGNLIWTKRSGGGGQDVYNETLGYGVSNDYFNNIYLTGSYSGISNFDSLTINSTNMEDVFVAKYNSNGHLIWLKTAAGSYQEFGFGIVADSIGNTFVTGESNGTINFGSGDLIGVGWSDIFICKYDSNGNSLWAINACGYQGESSMGISIDKNDNCYITGKLEDAPVTFGSILLTGNGWNLFVAKANKNDYNIINENTSNCNLIPSPNPFHNFTTLTISSKINLNNSNFVLYNSIGKEVLQIHNIQNNQIILKRENLLNGIYFYQLQNKEEIVSNGKLIIY